MQKMHQVQCLPFGKWMNFLVIFMIYSAMYMNNTSCFLLHYHAPKMSNGVRWENQVFFLSTICNALVPVIAGYKALEDDELLKHWLPLQPKTTQIYKTFCTKWIIKLTLWAMGKEYHQLLQILVVVLSILALIFIIMIKHWISCPRTCHLIRMQSNGGKTWWLCGIDKWVWRVYDPNIHMLPSGTIPIDNSWSLTRSSSL